MTALVSNLTESYLAQNFAFVGVIVTLVLPGLVFAPLGGLLADRYDRRWIMAIADVARCGLLLSIVLIGTAWWLVIASLLVGFCSTLWIPAKESALPNLLQRPDQVEAANQLGLLMTYGITIISAAGGYAVISQIGSSVNVVITINAGLYLASAAIIATRIPELSRRSVAVRRDKTESGGTVRDAVRYVRSTPLIRGLLIGMTGAFTAAGTVAGSAKPYAVTEAAFGWLLLAAVLGLATGVAVMPRLARRLPYDRLFGVSIVSAGAGLVGMAVSPSLYFSLAVVAVVGACSGAAFLTGVTIIGSSVEDSIRGRINAIYQTLLKVVFAGAAATAPLVISLTHATRPVMLAAALVALGAGIAAYRQMDTRRAEPIVAGLRNAMRRRPIRPMGLFVVVEGPAAEDQAQRLAAWLDSTDRYPFVVVPPQRPAVEMTAPRAQALAAAAVQADIIAQEVQPALAAGSAVVLINPPVSNLPLPADEVNRLTRWANGRLYPDITVVLSTPPADSPADEWNIGQILRATVESSDYVFVDTTGTPEENAHQIRDALVKALKDDGHYFPRS